MFINQKNKFNNTLSNGYIVECDDLIETEEKCKKCLQNLGEEKIICWRKE